MRALSYGGANSSRKDIGPAKEVKARDIQVRISRHSKIVYEVLVEIDA